jgi:hypothetical protein
LCLIAEEEDLLSQHQHADYVEQKQVLEKNHETIKQTLDRELQVRQEMAERHYLFTIERLKQELKVLSTNVGQEAIIAKGDALRRLFSEKEITDRKERNRYRKFS